MKKFLKTCVVLGAISSICFAQSGVSITGKVSDQSGKGLSGAVVRLATLALETETDANGNYALGSGVVNVRPFLTEKSLNYAKPVLSSGRVLFTIDNDQSRVHFSTYNLSGKFVADLFDATLNQGNYTVALDTRTIASGAYVLKVAINGSSYAMKFTSVGAASLSGQTASSASTLSSVARLSKTTLAVNDTIKVTKPAYSIARQFADVSSGTYDFTLTSTSTWDGDTNVFWGDTSTYPKSNSSGISYIILNRTNGRFTDDKIFWSDQQNGTKISLAQQSTYRSTSNGRFYVWVAPNDSGNRYFEFSEVNINAATRSWYGNTTRVDGWRLPYAIRVHCSDGFDIALGDEYYQFYQPRQSVFDEFKNEVPVEFTPLATHDFANIWAPHMSPVNIFNTGGPQVNYFNAYQDSVIAVQTNPPAKTTAWNIFACAGTGTMGANRDFSSAINRHCGTLPQSEWLDDANYYKAAPCNYFSKWCHRRSLHNRCYGYPYDDVGQHESYVAKANVEWVIMAVGW